MPTYSSGCRRSDDCDGRFSGGPWMLETWKHDMQCVHFVFSSRSMYWTEWNKYKRVRLALVLLRGFVASPHRPSSD
ncbi:hypothetical protein HETIRDRAFT_321667 [Heterobasidion irregulare TC 32-1]|uniref:Uncharacterized protein n=1 Tax=Heterobasidion irregulare (strain TC 32-1) TaxID=747525 RepID=W4K3S2_HETIT|nr:uncharacterized protein HETIRDRAFT_321667 [Heterobasidion irregulare TC 32-1]ETW79716.1 hypothetical protein HETIRDRAFT_321667 [Heterobasidion irregulare TC 32-1]